MVTPREQKEFVLKYATKSEFAEAFNEKYAGTMSFSVMTARIRSLWDRRDVHAIEVAGLKAKEEQEEIERSARDHERNHTIMIPARIVSKHSPRRDAVPDIGETLIRTNHLLAELVQLQKEQYALFKEIKEVRK